MRGDLALPEALFELMRDAFDEAAGVDEDDRSALCLDVPDDAVVDIGVQLVRGDRTELVSGDLDAEVEGALVADVDDGAIRWTVEDDAFRSDEQAGDLGDRVLCGAE